MEEKQLCQMDMTNLCEVKVTFYPRHEAQGGSPKIPNTESQT